MTRPTRSPRTRSFPARTWAPEDSRRRHRHRTARTSGSFGALPARDFRSAPPRRLSGCRRRRICAWSVRRRPRCRRPACKTLPTSLLTFDGSGLFGTFEALGADAATKIIFPWSSRAPWRAGRGRITNGRMVVPSASEIGPPWSAPQVRRQAARYSGEGRFPMTKAHVLTPQYLRGSGRDLLGRLPLGVASEHLRWTGLSPAERHRLSPEHLWRAGLRQPDGSTVSCRLNIFGG